MTSWLVGALAISLQVGQQPPPQPVPTPVAPAAPSTPRPKLKRKTAKGMLIGGTVGTLAFTWISGLVAGIYRDSGDASKREHGRFMPIPFAGPIIVAGSDSAQRPIASLGIYQGASIAILTIGAVSEYRHRQFDRAEGRTRRLDKSTGILLITQGVMWLGLSYSITLGLSRSKAAMGDEFNRRMQVPLVGGFLAAPVAPNYTRGYLGLTSSAVQLASATCIALGATAIARRRRSQRLSILPRPQPDGATITASMRF